MQKVLLISDGRHLAGRVFGEQRGSSGQRGILFVHGQGSSQTGYEERARLVSRALSAVCLTFDLSGHGLDVANFERYSACDHLNDLITAYDHLASIDAIDGARIGVCGASYGAYLAALLSAHRAIARLILRAPSLAKDAHFSALRETQSSTDKVPNGFDSIKVLRSYTGDVLILESEKDEIIPKSYIAAYLSACARVRHQVISGATHALTNPKWDEIFVNVIIRWFESL